MSGAPPGVHAESNGSVLRAVHRSLEDHVLVTVLLPDLQSTLLLLHYILLMLQLVPLHNQLVLKDGLVGGSHAQIRRRLDIQCVLKAYVLIVLRCHHYFILRLSRGHASVVAAVTIPHISSQYYLIYPNSIYKFHLFSSNNK